MVSLIKLTEKIWRIQPWIFFKNWMFEPNSLNIEDCHCLPRKGRKSVIIKFLKQKDANRIHHCRKKLTRIDLLYLAFFLQYLLTIASASVIVGTLTSFHLHMFLGKGLICLVSCTVYNPKYQFLLGYKIIIKVFNISLHQ